MASTSGAPLGRQLGSLLDRKSYKSDLAVSSILDDISRGPSTSSSELHKFNLRINSLLHSNQDVAKGLTLALEYIRHVPWDTVVSSASPWISSALTHFSLARKEAILLLDQFLGKDAMQKAEYWRNVASNGVSKYAITLLQAAENDENLDDATMVCILTAISTQIKLYPSFYRSQAAQIQQLCIRLLTTRQSLAAEIGILLAVLHRTGKDSTIQSQLWKATLDLLIIDAEIAWFSCSSCFQVDESNKGGNGLLSAISVDSIEALGEGHSRLKLLLGTPPHAGLLGIILSEPTLHAVPVPLDRLINLVLDILSITHRSSPRQDPAPEATLLASQSALLSSAHITALTLLASLPIGIFYAKRKRILNRIMRTIEGCSAPIRCIAFNVLIFLNLSLNPEDSSLLRCARTCLAQIARLVRIGNSVTSNASAGKTEANERSKKRRKVFSSDQVQFTNPKGFADIDQDEYAACIAAIKYLSMIYPGLATHLSSEHRDLAQTTALILLGVTEISLHAPDDLSAGCLEALSVITRTSRGSILALLTTKASYLASQGLQSLHSRTKNSAEMLLHVLEMTFHPRLPTKLDLRLHVDNDDFQGGEEEPILSHPEINEDRGIQEVEALREVLYIQEETNTNGKEIIYENGNTSMTINNTAASSPLPESPKRQIPRNSLQLSPDPVKPFHRPSTPRIGSPSLSHSTAAMTTSTTGVVTSTDNTINGGLIREQDRSTSTCNTQSSLSVGTTVPIASSSSLINAKASTSSPLSPFARERQQDDDLMKMDDSDDEPLPEIDLRSSDEEDEEDDILTNR